MHYLGFGSQRLTSVRRCCLMYYKNLSVRHGIHFPSQLDKLPSRKSSALTNIHNASDKFISLKFDLFFGTANAKTRNVIEDMARVKFLIVHSLLLLPL